MELDYTTNSWLYMKWKMLEFQHMPNAVCLSNCQVMAFVCWLKNILWNFFLEINQ